MLAQVEPDAAWLERTAGIHELPEGDAGVLATNLTVPNLNYGWPEELGGRCGFAEAAAHPRGGGATGHPRLLTARCPTEPHQCGRARPPFKQVLP